MEIDIEIDGLTNCLVKRATGEECDTQYRLISKTITKADATKLKEEGWLFDCNRQLTLSGLICVRRFHF